MITIIKFPQKPTNKDYPFYKEPRKALAEPDEIVGSMTSGVKEVFYLKNYTNEWDNLTDKEIIEKYNEHPNVSKIEIGERKSGNGYNTTDKKWFIRIIRK